MLPIFSRHRRCLHRLWQRRRQRSSFFAFIRNTMATAYIVSGDTSSRSSHRPPPLRSVLIRRGVHNPVRPPLPPPVPEPPASLISLNIGVVGVSLGLPSFTLTASSSACRCRHVRTAAAAAAAATCSACGSCSSCLVVFGLRLSNAVTHHLRNHFRHRQTPCHRHRHHYRKSSGRNSPRSFFHRTPAAVAKLTASSRP